MYLDINPDQTDFKKKGADSKTVSSQYWSLARSLKWCYFCLEDQANLLHENTSDTSITICICEFSKLKEQRKDFKQLLFQRHIGMSLSQDWFEGDSLWQIRCPPAQNWEWLHFQEEKERWCGNLFLSRGSIPFDQAFNTLQQSVTDAMKKKVSASILI